MSHNPQTRSKIRKTRKPGQKFGKTRKPANIKAIKQYKSIRHSKFILYVIQQLAVFVHVYDCVIHFITALSSKNWEPGWRLKPENRHIFIIIPETRAKKNGKTRDLYDIQNQKTTRFSGKTRNPMAKIGQTRNQWNPKAPFITYNRH